MKMVNGWYDIRYYCNNYVLVLKYTLFTLLFSKSYLLPAWNLTIWGTKILFRQLPTIQHYFKPTIFWGGGHPTFSGRGRSPTITQGLSPPNFILTKKHFGYERFWDQKFWSKNLRTKNCLWPNIFSNKNFQQ